ncbi:uncharacterized protein VP01_710g4 [Puccinia sorghi]|uniref:Uncharacterized protein n=1 Tax=Puccinia sorghi TaxID=27349 RepID=A0A0L6UED9_9BASI|nr:uncharacterized protein VP01_710g4 [Puccinia sorghi]
MRQQPSQHKQLLQAATTQTWKITFPFANTNTSNDTLQPGTPPLNLIHNTICLPSKAFLNPASINFYIGACHVFSIFCSELSAVNPLQDVSIELAIATCHLGSNGNGAAFLRLKNLFQIRYRTINMYTTRLIKVIYNMQSQLESWPTQEEQVELSQAMKEEGFPGYVSFMDGTMITLFKKPLILSACYQFRDNPTRYNI